MAEADPRGTGRAGSGQEGGRGGQSKLLWSLSKHDLHYSQVACGVIHLPSHHLPTYPLTALATQPLSASLLPPLTTYPLPHATAVTADKKCCLLSSAHLGNALCARLPHLPPGAFLSCSCITQSTLKLSSISCSSVLINRFHLSNT